MNRLCNNQLINRLLLRAIDNRAMYATTNYTIGSHDHRIVYSFSHKECIKVSKEAVYCLFVRSYKSKPPYFSSQTACLIKKNTVDVQNYIEKVKIIIKPINRLINRLQGVNNQLCTFGPGHSCTIKRIKQSTRQKYI